MLVREMGRSKKRIKVAELGNALAGKQGNRQEMVPIIEMKAIMVHTQHVLCVE